MRINSKQKRAAGFIRNNSFKQLPTFKGHHQHSSSEEFSSFQDEPQPCHHQAKQQFGHESSSGEKMQGSFENRRRQKSYEVENKKQRRMRSNKNMAGNGQCGKIMNVRRQSYGEKVKKSGQFFCQSNKKGSKRMFTYGQDDGNGFERALNIENFNTLNQIRKNNQLETIPTEPYLCDRSNREENQEELITEHPVSQFKKNSIRECVTNESKISFQSKSGLYKSKGGICFDLDVNQFTQPVKQIATQSINKRTRKVNKKEEVLKRRQMAKNYDKEARGRVFGAY